MAIKFGIIAGLATIATFLLAYTISIDAFLSQWIYWGTMLFYVIAMVLLANKVVDQGAVHFREIVRPLFICFLIANLIYYTFYFIMITYVNPDIYTEQVNRMSVGLQDLNIKEVDMSFQFGRYALSYFQAAIGGFMIASSISYSKKQS